MEYLKLYIYGLATMVFITAASVLAAVRWFHMCSPYDKHPKYYYPGRSFVTFSLLTPLTLLPYVANPSNIDSWILVKCYFLPFQIFLMNLMLLGYFTGVLQRSRWTRPLHAVGIPIALLLLTTLVLAIWPGEQLSSKYYFNLADLAIGLLGGVSTIVCVFSMWTVKKWAQRYDEDEYSNPMDFPVHFAKALIWLITICMALLWITAATDNQLVMSGIQLFSVVLMVTLLIKSLPPNRHRVLETTDNAASHPEELHNEEVRSGDNQIPENTAEQVLSAIRKVVEENKAFLESHLTLNDVAIRSGYNRTYVATVIKTKYGGFFKYINSLRLDYADEYKRTHPDASVSELVSESGFGSRQTYYNVKASLRQALKT